MVMITDQTNIMCVKESEIITLMMATSKIIIKTTVITEKRERKKTMISRLMFLFLF